MLRNLGLLQWDELPFINVQTAFNLYYDLEVLSPTKCENRGKVHLVGKFFHLGGHCHL